jgi:hypothetical protein
MPSLKEAKAAIESEMSQIVSRLSLLKLSLEHLEAAIQQSDLPSKLATPGHARKPTMTTKNSKALPKTGESFWLQFMSQEPKPADEVFSSALSDLSITPTSESAKILRQRLSVILSTMAKKGVIKTEGIGRSKRYAQA